MPRSETVYPASCVLANLLGCNLGRRPSPHWVESPRVTISLVERFSSLGTGRGAGSVWDHVGGVLCSRGSHPAAATAAAAAKAAAATEKARHHSTSRSRFRSPLRWSIHADHEMKGGVEKSPQRYWSQDLSINLWGSYFVTSWWYNTIMLRIFFSFLPFMGRDGVGWMSGRFSFYHENLYEAMLQYLFIIDHAWGPFFFFFFFPLFLPFSRH